MDMSRMTLGEVAEAWRFGSLTEAEVDAYLALWNATPCRFTEAKRIGQSIVQVDKP